MADVKKENPSVTDALDFEAGSSDMAARQLRKGNPPDRGMHHSDTGTPPIYGAGPEIERAAVVNPKNAGAATKFNESELSGSVGAHER